jgi:phosphopantetheinyl transferase
LLPDPVADEFTLREEAPSKWTPEQLYEHGTFHGPAFRGVISMERTGEDGAEATLEVLPSRGLFAADHGRVLLTDPVLLDQPGQVVAFWMAEHLEQGYVVFPFRLEALHVYGPLLPPHERVKCQARIDLIGDWQVRSHLDVVRGDGRVWARLVGWEDRRFDLPRELFLFLLSPQDVVLSEPWPTLMASLPEPQRFQAYRLSLDSFPEGFLTAHGGIWQRALAYLVLGRRERQLWHSLKMPEPRRLEWLLGRIVAKDAVRQFLRHHHARVLRPADIEILPDDDGRPVVTGSWTELVPCAPILSLSHTAGVAVAVVGDGHADTGIGVDIEVAGRMNEKMEKLAFSPHERELLFSSRHFETDDWPLRFWCAKEAAAKALGLGLAGGPQSLVVKELNPEAGTVQVGLVGELARRVHAGNHLTLTAFTARDGDLILATSLHTSDGRPKKHEEKA